jgi:hypothetical protein
MNTVLQHIRTPQKYLVEILDNPLELSKLGHKKMALLLFSSLCRLVSTNIKRKTPKTKKPSRSSMSFLER